MNMKNYTINKNRQQGIALLSVVLITTIFAILGMMNAQKAKESERMAGSNVRYTSVFEAAEQTLRDAGDYLLRIDGSPYVDNGANGRDKAANFDTSNIDTVDFVSDPGSAIVWNRETLATDACGAGSCLAGIDFVTRMDSNIWKDLAIQSSFDASGCDATSTTATTTTTAATGEVACENYRRDVETYTFIERLRTNDGSGGGGGGASAREGSLGLVGTGYETYYLITVKGSGFPPGTSNTDKNNPLNSRENVIIQGIFARL